MGRQRPRIGAVVSGCRLRGGFYPVPESEPSEWDDSDRELVQLCLDVVSEEDFTLFRRVTLDGWTYVDAAKAAGISLWACYKRVERTQKKLRRAIEEHPERFF